MRKLKRNLYIMKCRTHVLVSHLLERVLHALSKTGLIVEHKKDYTHVHDQGNPQTAPDLKSERFVFSVSYVIYKIEFTSEYWFETKRGKRIYTVYENHHTESRVSFRAELKSFYAHFSHKIRMWVHRETPRVVIPTNAPITFAEQEMGFRYHTCDFSQCRFALEMRLASDQTHNTSEEVISESYRVLGNTLTSKIIPLNKILTGAENDGNLTSPQNCPLVDNIICRECGYPVFATPTGNYIFECIHHGEISYPDCERVDPKKYEGILANCMYELERFCECPQD